MRKSTVGSKSSGLAALRGGADSFPCPKSRDAIATPVRAWIRTLLRFPSDQSSPTFAMFLPLALLLLFIASTPCLAQQTLTLRKIEFVGLKKLTPPQAIEASGLKIGDSVTREAIDAAADKLMQSGLFKKLA